MPLGNAIIGQALMDAIVAEVIEETVLHLGAFGVGMDVSQSIEDSVMIRIWEPTAVIALLPKMSSSPQHLVKAHSGIPVNPVHDFG